MTAANSHQAQHDIRLLSEADDLAEMSDLLQQVWGTSAPIANLEMLTAIAYSGGYVAGTFSNPEDDEDAEDDVGPVMVGASLGLLARHRGLPALHSHITGLHTDVRGTGLGRALKLHQRQWASENGIEWITWTFDPLVRRNAWFNIAVLGAEVDAYLPSFYGTMHDAINAGDESDRLHVAWDVRSPLSDEVRDGSATRASQLVPTPEDIVELRRTDPDAAARWRRETRDALTAAIDASRPILGFTTDGQYVIGTNE